MNKKKLLALTLSIATATVINVKANYFEELQNQAEQIAQDTATIRLTFEVAKNEKYDKEAWEKIISLMLGLLAYCQNEANVNDKSWLDESAKVLKKILELGGENIAMPVIAIPVNASAEFLDKLNQYLVNAQYKQ